MSIYGINDDELSIVMDDFYSQGGKLTSLSNEIANIDLSFIGSNGATRSLIAGLNDIQSSMTFYSSNLKSFGSASNQVIGIFRNTEDELVTRIGNTSSVFAGIGGAVIAGGQIGTIISGTTNYSVDAEDEISDFDLAEYFNLSKGEKKLAKNLTKAALKKIHKGSEKVIDILDIVEKVEKGDYFEAVEKIPGLGGIKSWDFKKLKDIPKGSKDFSGIMDTGALKFQAVMKTLKLTTEKDGYIARYMDKYETDAMNYLKQGNIVGTMYSMSAEFIQTVGKGTVDVTCQLISSGLDSAVKTVTFGLVDVSTINALMEDNWGFSPGTLFNGAAGAISDGVDFVLDDVIPSAGKFVGDVVGKATSAGGKAISSSLKFLGDLF